MLIDVGHKRLWQDDDKMVKIFDSPAVLQAKQDKMKSTLSSTRGTNLLLRKYGKVLDCRSHNKSNVPLRLALCGETTILSKLNELITGSTFVLLVENNNNWT